MPHLIVVSAAESSQRRLLLEVTGNCRSSGYEIREGGVWDSWEALFSDAMTTGLFSSRFARVIENAQSLGPFPEILKSSLEGADEDVVLVLLYSGNHGKFLSRQVLDLSTVREGESVPFWPSKRISWLLEKAQSRGMALSQDAASIMVEWVDDGEELLSVLDTLAAFSAGAPVDADMVRKMVLNQRSRGMLNLLDGFSSRRAGLCIQGLTELRNEGEMITVLSALHKRVRFAYYLGRFGKNAGWEKALGMTPYQARQAGEGADLYDVSELAGLLAGIVRLSIAERCGSGEGWPGLERLLLPIM